MGSSISSPSPRRNEGSNEFDAVLREERLARKGIVPRQQVIPFPRPSLSTSPTTSSGTLGSICCLPVASCVEWGPNFDRDLKELGKPGPLAHLQLKMFSLEISSDIRFLRWLESSAPLSESLALKPECDKRQLDPMESPWDPLELSPQASAAISAYCLRLGVHLKQLYLEFDLSQEIDFSANNALRLVRIHGAISLSRYSFDRNDDIHWDLCISPNLPRRLRGFDTSCLEELILDVSGGSNKHKEHAPVEELTTVFYLPCFEHLRKLSFLDSEFDWDQSHRQVFMSMLVAILPPLVAEVTVFIGRSFDRRSQAPIWVERLATTGLSRISVQRPFPSSVVF
ncbi:hypothetical protein DFH06DRAFT_484554 [Mycena polygramma]|nr:hypothetical protein DFH06DRAFT_484554 [Mycena polygramma]